MSKDNDIIHQGSLISVHKERVELKNSEHTYFDIVKHPGGSVIAAINDNDEICLLKQWRHAIQQSIWELPAGCLEPDETPLETAKRELEEEAAVVAGQWYAHGKIIPSPGFSNEILYLFEARRLGPGKLKLDDAEVLEAHWLPLAQVHKMAANDEILDAKTLTLLHKLKRNKLKRDNDGFK